MNIGVIGLGIIGSRVAARLRQKGCRVYVWSRSPKPEPNFLGSPAEVAEACEVIQMFVPDAQALFDVLDRMEPMLTPKHLVLCSATVGPEATVEAAKIVNDRGAQFLDAPFTGSKQASEQGNLVYLVGGMDAVLERARPFLEATGKAIVKVGDIGQAATVKVATNMMAAVAVQTLAEARAIVMQAGVAPEVFSRVLENHGVRSPLLDLKLPKMDAGDFEPHFSLKHMFKDVQLGIHIANSLDLDIPATTATAGVMYGGLNRGWENEDYAVVSRVYDPEPQPEVKAPEAVPMPVPPADAAQPPSAVAAPHPTPVPAPANGETDPPKETLSRMSPGPRPGSGGEEPAPSPAVISPDAAATEAGEAGNQPAAADTETETKKPARPVRRWFAGSRKA